MSASKTKSIKRKPVPDQLEFETTQTLVQEQATPLVAPDEVVVVKRSRELEDFLGATGHALKIASHERPARTVPSERNHRSTQTSSRSHGRATTLSIIVLSPASSH